MDAAVKWLSCEPLLEPLQFQRLDLFDWVVIGGQSQTSGAPAFQPPWEWVEDLMRQVREAGCLLYFKPNLETRPQEYPTDPAALRRPPPRSTAHAGRRHAACRPGQGGSLSI